jgi:hypothetical protein
MRLQYKAFQIEGNTGGSSQIGEQAWHVRGTKRVSVAARLSHSE